MLSLPPETNKQTIFLKSRFSRFLTLFLIGKNLSDVIKIQSWFILMESFPPLFLIKNHCSSTVLSQVGLGSPIADVPMPHSFVSLSLSYIRWRRERKCQSSFLGEKVFFLLFWPLSATCWSLLHVRPEYRIQCEFFVRFHEPMTWVVLWHGISCSIGHYLLLQIALF